MPKMKTHRGAAKRFKITGTGRLRHRQAFRSHILEKKSSTRTRRLGREVDVSSGDANLAHSIVGKLPNDFLFSLSKDGSPRRRCRVALRSENHLGVRFLAIEPARRAS